LQLAACSLQLAALDTAYCIDELDIPGYRLHPLKGNRKVLWSITVNV
jgi:proteic killer suppression protein